LAAAASSLLFFIYRMSDLLKTNWLAFAGLFCLLVLIVSRATSFHHMDIFSSTYYFRRQGELANGTEWIGCNRIIGIVGWC
jgi:hypothetical protein